MPLLFLGANACLVLVSTGLRAKNQIMGLSFVTSLGVVYLSASNIRSSYPSAPLGQRGPRPLRGQRQKRINRVSPI